MAPKFGTSGLRGLVNELTDSLVSDYVRAFLGQCETGGTVFIGWDLRDSSPHIARQCIQAAKAVGVSVVNCGVLPTPALALAAQEAAAGAIMITGSHIPADRNGIKFYTTSGEITKENEAQIVGALGQSDSRNTSDGAETDGAAAARQLFVDRYTSVFPDSLIAGMRVGVYQHSSVARDLLVEILQKLGAEPIPLERTSKFVPVDTEAVDATVRKKFADWCRAENLDALVSTDGDADRPMLTDSTGTIVPGDVLGAISAEYLKAEVLCTPVSSNTMITRMPNFTEVYWTQIGSPYVVAGIEAVLTNAPGARVVGYEANGGFLLGFEYRAERGAINPLLTRDCVMPIVATLASAKGAGISIAELVKELPGRFTAADRIAGIDSEISQAFLKDLKTDAAKRRVFFHAAADEVSLDTTDGLRVTFANQDVVHLRPSGNAPEFRCYAESASPERSRDLVAKHLDRVARALA